MVLRSKNTIFSLDFETLFTKHSPCKILGLNFGKKTTYLNYNFTGLLLIMYFTLGK